MISELNFDVEFLPVGDGTKAGDAIVISYGVNEPTELVVVDGGTEDSGNAMVDHIKRHFGADVTISHMISTHPDSDHSSGLRPVIENFGVTNLWLHGLWHHAGEMLHLFEDKRWTVDGLARAIKKEYPIVEELIDLAYARGTRICEPFQGAQLGPFTVLSPSLNAYLHLVPQFRKTPDPDVDALKQQRMWIEPRKSIFAILLEKASELVPETWEIETLREGGVTAAENETSVVLHGNFGDSAILLTADAGINALTWSYNFGCSAGLDFEALSLIQVPHHGSRNNVSPTLLDRILGFRQQRGEQHERRKSIVSAPKDDKSHPRKVVMNAFLRRGAPVRTTQGSKYRFNSGFPARDGYEVAKPLNFFKEVEKYD